MSKIIEITKPDQLNRFRNSKIYQDFDPDILIAHKPDIHLICVDDYSQVEARCSLWWTDVPAMEGEKLGIIGHFAADNELGEMDNPSHVLLNNACFRLKVEECTRAIGPMDGNTWRAYRFVTEQGNEPAFFLEPTNPSNWPRYWENYGFEPIAQYTSAVTSDLNKQDDRLVKVEERLVNKGIQFRELDLNHFEDELKKIYDISIVSFSHNFLYTPLDLDSFISQYQKVKELVKPELTLIAELNDRPVGFLFAIPDINEQLRGETVKTIIIKTVAVLPENAHAGLGALLVDKVQQKAKAMGFERAIHALMYDGNVSRNISGHYAEVMRRYTLYSRPFR